MKRKCPACSELVGDSVFSLAAHARRCGARHDVRSGIATSTAGPAQVGVDFVGANMPALDALPELDVEIPVFLGAEAANQRPTEGPSPARLEKEDAGDAPHRFSESDVDSGVAYANHDADEVAMSDTVDDWGAEDDTGGPCCDEAMQGVHAQNEPEDPDGLIPVNITGDIKADDVVAFMLHGMTNKQKNNIFTGMKVLTHIAKFNGTPHDNPMRQSAITTTEGFDKHMDAQAEQHFCKFDRFLVPIASEVAALASLPPIPVYCRPLPEVLTSAFAASSSPEAGFNLRPQRAANFHPGTPSNEDRVETPMQGSLAQAAFRV